MGVRKMPQLQGFGGRIVCAPGILPDQ